MNTSDARSRAYGIAVISVFIKVAKPKEISSRSGQGSLKESKLSKPNLELKMLTDQLQHIVFKGDSVPLKALSIHELLPQTSALITYEGSLTTPGCEETATWILLNRPLYVSPQQVPVTFRQFSLVQYLLDSESISSFFFLFNSLTIFFSLIRF